MLWRSSGVGTRKRSRRNVRRASTKGSQFAILSCESIATAAFEFENCRGWEFESAVISICSRPLALDRRGCLCRPPRPLPPWLGQRADEGWQIATPSRTGRRDRSPHFANDNPSSAVGSPIPGAVPGMQLAGRSSLANQLGGIRGTILASARNTGTRWGSGSGTGCLLALCVAGWDQKPFGW